MVTRLISAGVGLILFALVMFIDKLVLTVSVAIISSIAVYEGLKSYGYNKYKLFTFIGCIIPFIFAFSNYIKNEIVFLILILIVTLYVAFLLEHHNEFFTKDFFAVLVITIGIPLSFATLSYIRNMENGKFYVWLPFISSWLTDTFAYFGGFFFGKKKLCPNISPKKTVEGAVSGVIGAVIGYALYSYLLNNVWGVSVNTLWFILIAVFTSVTSQMGDLLASLMKRENGIKDFGNLMPGHGGALDRFDSILITAPFIFILLQFIV